MKERIVVDVQEYCKQCKKQSCRTKYCWLKRKKDEGRFEQVPETFEDLKELCVKKFRLVFSKNLNMEKENEYIVCCWMNFYENGDILNRDGFVIAESRTPQQMWAIIKNLIGEE